MSEDVPFWKGKRLAEMTGEEWESLCDGCGRCCLVKLVEDGGPVVYTDVACRLLDATACRCRSYADRRSHVPDCIALRSADVAALDWLPPTCAYRLVAAGEDLYWWHHLVSGDRSTVHAAGVSVRGRTVSELVVPEADLEDHIVSWPTSLPRRKQKKGRVSRPNVLDASPAQPERWRAD